MDIPHLERQIQDDQVRADDKQKHAQTLRENAQKMYDGEDDARRQWLNDEADKLEQDAAKFAEQVQATQQQLDQAQQKLAELQKQRDAKVSQYEQEIQLLDSQINEVRGPTTLL